MLAAAPVKVLTTGATGVVEDGTTVDMVELVVTGAAVVTGVVVTGAGVADEVHSSQAVLEVATGAGATEDVQSFQTVLEVSTGAGATEEDVQSFHAVEEVATGAGATDELVHSSQAVLEVSTGAGATVVVGATEEVQSFHLDSVVAGAFPPDQSPQLPPVSPPCW